MGGGLKDSKCLFCNPDQSNATSVATDLDLDRYDKGSIVIVHMQDYMPGAAFQPIVLSSSPTDGYEALLRNDEGNTQANGASLKYIKQPNWLWTIRFVIRTGEQTNSYKLMSVIGMRTVKPLTSAATYKETSTMAVANDSPVSAANLKAVVEKLMGGGISPRRL